MAVVTPLRRARPPEDEAYEPVSVVRLVQFLGPISPELVLVDPELGERARALLPEVPGIRVARRRKLEEPWPVAVAPSGRRRNLWRLATVSAVAAACIASFGLGLSLAAGGVDTEPSMSSPSPTATPAPPSKAPPVAQPAPAEPTGTGKSAVAPPRFVWAPEPGAVGYRVALYRDERLIFERDVTKPALVLSSTWTHGGRLQRLTRGPYRWVVWALVRKDDSLRRGRAIVSAQYVAS